MNIVIAVVHYNQSAIGLPDHVDRVSTHFQSGELIHDNPMESARAPKCSTVGNLLRDLLLTILGIEITTCRHGVQRELLDGMPSYRKKYHNGDAELTQLT